MREVWLVLCESKVEGEGSRRGDVMEVGWSDHGPRLGRLIVNGLQSLTCTERYRERSSV